MANLDIRLKKADRIYRQGEMVSGVVAVASKGTLSHNGITLVMEGSVVLQMSGKNVGVFDAFYNSLKPIQMVNYSVEIAKPGKLPDGQTELPFEFRLEPLAGLPLYETYHGVFINISYCLKCDMIRPLLAKNLQKVVEFIVEVKTDPKTIGTKDVKTPFTVTPEVLENVKKTSISKIPKFKINGFLQTAICDISKPFWVKSRSRNVTPSSNLLNCNWSGWRLVDVQKDIQKMPQKFKTFKLQMVTSAEISLCRYT
eukprot:TRINITY_DN2939_c0_g1_i4.p1 TRINITY_DN2939_c0_g1~~TRINITY_DN2939_c0_g1_i4.p1  ORF type:complete len:267 (+),score=41.64 TRINITY_DN2939_c0_g1_i4:37-801(+)